MTIDKPQELQENISLLETIGDSLLLVKCYELAGESEKARTSAGNVSFSEMQRLQKRLNEPLRTTAELFLRVIYAYQMAGERSNAVLVLRRFMERATREQQDSGELDNNIAWRLVVAMIIIGEAAESVQIGRLIGTTENTSVKKLCDAWITRDKTRLQECYREIEEFIRQTEDIKPWSDTWHYILVSRLARATTECRR